MPVHFVIFPCFRNYRAIFSLLTVEISRAISSSRVTGLFTVRGIHWSEQQEKYKRVVCIISCAEVNQTCIPLRSYFERGQFALSRAEE